MPTQPKSAKEPKAPKAPKEPKAEQQGSGHTADPDQAGRAAQAALERIDSAAKVFLDKYPEIQKASMHTYQKYMAEMAQLNAMHMAQTGLPLPMQEPPQPLQSIDDVFNKLVKDAKYREGSPETRKWWKAAMDPSVKAKYVYIALYELSGIKKPTMKDVLAYEGKMKMKVATASNMKVDTVVAVASSGVSKPAHGTSRSRVTARPMAVDKRGALERAHRLQKREASKFVRGAEPVVKDAAIPLIADQLADLLKGTVQLGKK